MSTRHIAQTVEFSDHTVTLGVCGAERKDWMGDEGVNWCQHPAVELGCLGRWKTGLSLERTF